jgi:hypothetical protein
VETTLTSMSAIRVWAERFPLTLELYGDDSLIFTKTVTSEEIFRVSCPDKHRKWSARIIGDSYVNGIFIASTVEELKNG